MNFPRRQPSPSQPAPGRPANPPQYRPEPVHHVAEPLEHPRPDTNGTLLALVGLAVTMLLANGDYPSHLAKAVSIGTIASIGFSVLMDLRLGGVRNLIRADLMAILAFYFLTFFEFLFPQPTFDTMIGVETTHASLMTVMLGFGGLFIGRHLIHPKTQPFSFTLTREIPAAWVIAIFWACVIIGYAHMIIAVNFNFWDMILWFMEPRFSQPWQRGKFGDWKALLVELGLFIYLIPPLGGIMLARRQRYGKMTLLFMSLGLLLTFFYGFSSGTRNIFASYLVTFLIAYAFALPFARRKELLILCTTSAVAMVGVSFFMLEFRSAGLMNYLKGDYEPPPPELRTYFVDYNLYAIARLVEMFPAKHDYLGWEIPYLAAIRPIPRAIWPGKPEGLSSSIEDALGVGGVTISASFAGEAYMSGGLFAVIVIGLGFGALTGWWSYLASSKNSELGILIYASGFFATVISMRSLFVFTTALLPTVAALVIGTYAVKMLAAQATKLMAKAALRQAPPRRPGPPVRRPLR